MFITKKTLPRRTFLRGMGVTMALPLLDAMVPALSAVAGSQASPPRRLGFIYLPNGVAMNFSGVNHWRPQGDGTSFELSPILSPLAPFRDQLLVVSGLSHREAEAGDDGSGDHARGTTTWLTGVKPRYTDSTDVRNGISADQVAAAVLGSESMLPSLELGIDLNYLIGNCGNGYSCVYLNTLAWRTATTPLPIENNPRKVFERLFGEGATSAQRLARARENLSILDSVIDQANRLQRALGPEDRTKVDNYLEAAREVERRIQTVEARNREVELPDVARPMGIPGRFDEHVTLMYDLLWLAFQADITRVVTFMLGRELNLRTYPEIGITEGHHPLSHHRDNPAQLEKYSRVNVYQTQLFASLLEKLRSTREGDGSLLDHSMFLYGAGLSDPNLHKHFDLPLTVLGGGFKGGRHLVYPVDTPMTNLLVSMLDRSGIPAETLGDSTGLLELSGL